MSVTAAAGFRAAGVAAGIKTTGGLDLALVVNGGPRGEAAGVFTRNRFPAAPVRWSQQVLRGGRVRAVVLNSGGANAATGAPGFQDAHATAEHVAAALSGAGAKDREAAHDRGGGLDGGLDIGLDGGLDGVGAGEVAVCSTGLIGQRLPMDRLLAGVDAAVAALSRDGGDDAATAILTTDTRTKSTVVDVGGFRVGGMAKGAGMLAPSLATMLVVLTTDALAPAAVLDVALREAVRTTFDRIDSDGCMSTNDTVLLLASGASGTEPSATGLADAVARACHDLAAQLVADAEGATKHVAIEVSGAASEEDAVAVGRAVARSNLVKTALFGNDPNWGRILGAVGTTAAAFAPDAVDVAINGVWVCRSGAVADDSSTVDLRGRDVSIQIALHAGEATATVLTADLSHGYVHENSAYSS